MAAWVFWLGVCVGLTAVTRNRPVLAVIFALALRILLPSYSGYHLSGSTITIHPASTFLVTRALIPLVFGRLDGLWAALRSSAGWILVPTCLLYLAETWLVQGRMAELSVINLWCAPACLVVLVLEAAAQRSEAMSLIGRSLCVLAGIESLFAGLQWATGSPLLFTGDRSGLWWASSTLSRASGTLDSPLDLAMFVCCAIPLLRYFSRPWQVLALGGVMVAGELASQSRVGIPLAVVAFIYVAWGSARSTLHKAALVTAVTVASTALLGVAAANGLLARFTGQDGANSDAARGSTRSIFFQVAPDHWFVGGGSGYSFQVSASLGSRTSLENGLFMSALDMGIALCLVVVALQCWLIVRAARAGHVQVAFASVLALIFEFSYSGLATPSANSLLSWAIFALAASAIAFAGGSSADDHEDSDEDDFQEPRSPEEWQADLEPIDTRTESFARQAVSLT